MSSQENHTVYDQASQLATFGHFLQVSHPSSLQLSTIHFTYIRFTMHSCQGGYIYFMYAFYIVISVVTYNIQSVAQAVGGTGGICPPFSREKEHNLYLLVQRQLLCLSSLTLLHLAGLLAGPQNTAAISSTGRELHQYLQGASTPTLLTNRFKVPLYSWAWLLVYQILPHAHCLPCFAPLSIIPGYAPNNHFIP